MDLVDTLTKQKKTIIFAITPTHKNWCCFFVTKIVLFQCLTLTVIKISDKIIQQKKKEGKNSKNDDNKQSEKSKSKEKVRQVITQIFQLESTHKIIIHHMQIVYYLLSK